MKQPLFIAEVKTCSPFGYKSEESWDELFEIANEHGDMIAIHTHPAWGGSLDLVRKAANLTQKPILAKGIPKNEEDIWAAMLAGANQVLTVGFVANYYWARTIFEPLDFNQLFIPKYQHPHIKVMWNSRNLIDGSRKVENFSKVRNNFDGWLCQASNIETWDHVSSVADAFIVGTHLKNFVNTKKYE